MSAPRRLTPVTCRQLLTIVSFIVTLVVVVISYHYPSLSLSSTNDVSDWTCSNIQHWTNQLVWNNHDHSSFIPMVHTNQTINIALNNALFTPHCSSVTSLEYMAWFGAYRIASNNTELVPPALIMKGGGKYSASRPHIIDAKWDKYDLPQAMKHLLTPKQRYYHSYIYAYSGDSYRFLHDEFISYYGGLFHFVLFPRVTLNILALYRWDAWVTSYTSYTSYIVPFLSYGSGWICCICWICWYCGLYILPQELQWIDALFATRHDFEFQSHYFFYFCGLFYLIHCILWYVYKIIITIACLIMNTSNTANDDNYNENNFSSLKIHFHQTKIMWIYDFGSTAQVVVVFGIFDYFNLQLFGHIVLVLKALVTIYGIFEYWAVEDIVHMHEKEE